LVSQALLASRQEIARLWGKIAGVVLILLFVAGMVQAAAQGFPKINCSSASCR